MNNEEKKLDSVPVAPPLEKYAVIELGGGFSPEYHPNFDAVCGDTICDLTEGIPLPNASIEGIYSKDFFEHLTFTEGLQLLKECWRVLLLNGFIEFIIPDIEDAIKRHSDWNEHLRNVIFGTRRHEYDYHKAWYSPSLMEFMLNQLGWHDIRIHLVPSLESKFIVKAKKK